MASAEQIKALLKSHIKGDDERFLSVAMQVAAHEAKLGHGKLAVELRALVDEAKNGRRPRPLDNWTGRPGAASTRSAIKPSRNFVPESPAP